MKALRNSLKKRLRKIIEILPWGEDFYHRYWIYPRANDLVRGKFHSFAECAAAAKGEAANNYDVNNLRKSVDREISGISRQFDISDYPAMFWLSRIVAPSSSVVELGGSVGYAFYNYDRYIGFNDSIAWRIVELPGAVTVGQEVAARLGETRLTFSNEIGEFGPVDIFYSSGTLQYLSDDLTDILSSMQTLPEHVILNRVPMYSGPEFWTLQHLGAGEVPYKVQSVNGIIEQMARLGYELLDQWAKHRSLRVAFTDIDVPDAYRGMYFKKKQ